MLGHRWSAVAFAIGLVSSVTSAGPVPPEMLVLSAQPAVFQIQVCGDFVAECPTTFGVNYDALDKDYHSEVAAGRLPADALESVYIWSRVVANADQCFIAGTERQKVTLEDRQFGHGTTFAVSREGIFVTNAHVIADPVGQALDANAVCEALSQQIAPPLNAAIAKIGPLRAADVDTIAAAITNWYARQTTVNGKFREARLALKYANAPLNINDTRTIEQRLSDRPKPITVPLTVLAVGAPMPGEDVAILKAQLFPNDRAEFERSGQHDPKSLDELIATRQNDKFICLPLGDSDDLLPGAKIQALGFASSAYYEGLQDEASQYRVSTRDGQVSQIKHSVGATDFIEMTANIDHGDSGGPVIDGSGKVIGITVGVGSAHAPSLAIPAASVRRYLTKAGISPDTGKLTMRWNEALIAYDKGDFTRAGELLKRIERFQGMVLNASLDDPDPHDLFRAMPGPALLPADDRLVNPCVKEMQVRIFSKTQPPK